ncbi:MAG: hypothetical protein AB7S26_25710 [Sandaracinaceae bacterium]
MLTTTSLALLGACAPDPGPESFVLDAHTTLVVQLAGVEARRTEESRVAYTLGDQVHVAMQRIDREGALPPDERTPTTVAEALVRRVELGDAEGELRIVPCAVPTSSAWSGTATCVGGWTAIDGTRFARTGSIFQVGQRIVWLDASGPDGREVALSEIATSALRSMRRADG